VIVGSGPNGLAAAVTLARAGLSVRVYEANDTAGGSARTLKSELTGALHDVGSAVHPMAVASPFFEAFELSKRVELLYPGISFGHPLSDGRAGLAFSSA
jgi:phytoene dehydrogenase-like protein